MPEDPPDDSPVGPLEEPPDFPVEPVAPGDAPEELLGDDFASLDLSPFDDPSLAALAPEPLDSRDAASDFAPEPLSLDDESPDDESFEDAPLGPLLR